MSLQHSLGEAPGVAVDQDAERCSEACWVSFTRQVSRVCPAAVRVHLSIGDVDRIPTDLGIVPMQISLRDVIALGLMIGMDLIYAGFDTLEMSGASGSFTSSQHPLLGTVVHFSTYYASNASGHKGLLDGDMSKSWLHRLQGVATIANQQYTEARREYFERLSTDWRSLRQRLLNRHDGTGEHATGDGSKATLLTFIDLNKKQHLIPVETCSTWKDLIATLEKQNIATPPYLIIGLNDKKVLPKNWRPLQKVLAQGNIIINFKIIAGDYAGTDLPDDQAVGPENMTMLEHLMKRRADQQIQPDERQARDTPPLLVPLGEKVNGEALPAAADGGAQGVQKYTAPYVEPEEAMPLVVYGRGLPPPPPPEPERVPRTTSFRKSRRDHRRARSSSSGSVRIRYRHFYPTARTPIYVPDPTKLTFFWASQIDVELGPWATPWRGGLFHDTLESLHMMVDVVLAAMEVCGAAARGEDAHMDEKKVEELRFVDFPGDPILNELFTTLRRNRHTWPPYAVNGKGGILEPDSHRVIEFAAFPTDELLPPLSLLRSIKNFQHEHDKSPPMSLSRSRTIELASLDWWLSHAGATHSILTSKDNLLVNTPAIVEEMFQRFQDKFFNAVRAQWSPDGGQPQVNRLANMIHDWLHDTFEEPADRYFLLVAFLRAIKVMQCIKQGSDTRTAYDLFKEDVLVYIV